MKKTPSLKDRLLKIAASGDLLLTAPDLPERPHTAKEALDQIRALLSWGSRVIPTLQTTTVSDSRLFRYSGAVLGARQLIVSHAVRAGTKLPGGFADASPKFVTTFASSLLLQGALDGDQFTPAYPLTDAAREIIDSWEEWGFGLVATDAFLLSHFYVPSLKQWAPLTPVAEATCTD